MLIRLWTSEDIDSECFRIGCHEHEKQCHDFSASVISILIYDK